MSYTDGFVGRADEARWVHGAPTAPGDYYICYEGPAYSLIGTCSVSLGTLLSVDGACTVYLARAGRNEVFPNQILAHIPLGRRPECS